jgi:pimeloyl-ACP methyl ester carboxylesterase
MSVSLNLPNFCPPAFKAVVLFCCLLLAAGDGMSQQTGDVVSQYFGRQRVEATLEGDVVHVFRQGLALRDALRPGMLTGGQDILAWQLATGRFRRPADGQQLEDHYEQGSTPLAWEALEADEDGFFRGDLGRAYVYTEFDAPTDGIALLEATGHTRVYINGLPREGDHYDYGYTLVPFRMKEGLNQFIYTYGRFARVSAKIVVPTRPVMFSPRDLTLPSLVRNERGLLWGGIRVLNATEEMIETLQIDCILASGEATTYRGGGLMPLGTRKLPFRIPLPLQPADGDALMATLVLRDSAGEELDRVQITLSLADAGNHHERTFVSRIDGSVQYYSVAPSTSGEDGQALFLSLHGASVEATNQTRAYQKKDWGTIVAPTNRRPFGFNWEEWGRIDALEVLAHARSIYPTDKEKTYLIGHSMGGHGTWFIGATYPDLFAAIAPAAAYPDIIGYRTTGSDAGLDANPHFRMIARAASPGRVPDLARNYLQSGVYVLHGEADGVVSVEQARMMREILGGFHNNFAYYEYPGGTHWDGDHSMDWPPLFDFLKHNTIQPLHTIDQIEFHTASPAVSATNHWLEVMQQEEPYLLSRVVATRRGDTLSLELENVRTIRLLLQELFLSGRPIVEVGGQTIVTSGGGEAILSNRDGDWRELEAFDHREKHPGRYGGFKLAFDNDMVFVYATQGRAEENQWWENKARFDAETFLYRGNGSAEVVPDTVFDPGSFANRNVILYGNATNNRAWNQLLIHCPVQVSDGRILVGQEVLEGDDLGIYFIYPRNDCEHSAIGVVAGTGSKGMMATWANDYFSGITGFPDLLIFSVDWLKDGVEGIRRSGFFDSDWKN